MTTLPHGSNYTDAHGALRHDGEQLSLTITDAAELLRAASGAKS